MTDSMQTERDLNAPKWGGVKAVYFLYLASFFVGFTGIIGVVVAYVFRGDNAVSDTHFRWQIRTFWIGVLFALLSAVTSIIGLGWVLLLVFLVWFLVRVVKGLKSALDKKPVSNPGSWLI